VGDVGGGGGDGDGNGDSDGDGYGDGDGDNNQTTIKLTRTSVLSALRSRGVTSLPAERVSAAPAPPTPDAAPGDIYGMTDPIDA
jgi:hypothetical protein